MRKKIAALFMFAVLFALLSVSVHAEILYGDKEGHIVSCGVTRGRKKAIEELVKKYEEKRLDVQDIGVYISHGDCLEEAEKLAALVKQATPDVDITICEHEPFSGAHVGPGMLALFFRGKER